MAPKRVYYAMDGYFTQDAAIEELGETYGPGGPLAIVALLCMAKRQPLVSNQGEVFTTARSLVAEAHLADREQARKIVDDACRLGILQGLDAAGDREIHVRFPRWSDWQERQRSAEKQAAYRDRQKTKGDSA
ncbi:MAG: hypothetical protein QOI10_2192 [Solirubrobacterales bacterium]|jgi:hypothetical protein|nr:hypothetical protein [Solirubrobacterales bacterium]